MIDYKDISYEVLSIINDTIFMAECGDITWKEAFMSIKADQHVDMDYYYDNFLDELYELTQVEYERKLTKKESERYVQLVEFLQDNNVPIKFGIEM